MSPVMRKGLGELVEPFKKIHTPLIVLQEQHTSYGAIIGKQHEAGFDSKVFILHLQFLTNIVIRLDDC
jgi:hypothetical protein